MTNPAQAEHAPTRILPTAVVALLCAVSAMTAVSVDIMLPATATIAKEFGLPERLGGLLVVIYLLGYASGQLVCGVASDAFGRRTVLLLSTAGFTLAGIGCALAPGFYLLLVLRFLQGLCGGAPVVARAVARDLGTGPETTKLIALFMATTAIGPLFAPIIGSAVLVVFHWRACFVLLALAGGVLWVLTYYWFEETLDKPRPERFSFRFIFSASRTLLVSREFLVSAGILMLNFAAYGSILAVSAVLVETVYGFSPMQFGLLFSVAALFAALGSVLVRVLAGRVSLSRILDIAMIILGVAVVFNAILYVSNPGLTVLWASLCLHLLAFGLILAAGMTAGLRPAGSMPGFAGSLLGALSMLGGFLGGAAATYFYVGTHATISGALAFFGVLVLAVFLFGKLSSRGSAAD